MRTRDKLIGVYVGILAVVLAICSTVKGWTSFSPKARLSKLRAIWR